MCADRVVWPAFEWHRRRCRLLVQLKCLNGGDKVVRLDQIHIVAAVARTNPLARKTCAYRKDQTTTAAAEESLAPEISRGVGPEGNHKFRKDDDSRLGSGDVFLYP